MGYAAALVLPAAALAVRFAVGDALLGYPFLTFFPAVLVTAFLGGWGPGLVAAALSGALATYFLIEPTHSFSVGGTSGQIGLAFFAAVSVTIVAAAGTGPGCLRWN